MLVGSDISKTYSDRTLFSGLTLNLTSRGPYCADWPKRLR